MNNLFAQLKKAAATGLTGFFSFALFYLKSCFQIKDKTKVTSFGKL
jgi:hypothetical protein